MTGLKKSDVCVLIPAYNEQAHIADLVREVRQMGYAVVVADDGSTDRTGSLAKEAGAEVLASENNLGKGAALRRGLEWVLSRDFQAVVLMDADGQHDPEQITSFVAALEDSSADLVVGNRMQRAGKMPWLRLITNRFMSLLISLIAGQRIPDTQCGYRAARRALIQKITLKTAHFETESEMLLEAGRKGFKIDSVPVRSVYEGGVSHIDPRKDTIRFFSFLFKYFFAR